MDAGNLNILIVSVNWISPVKTECEISRTHKMAFGCCFCAVHRLINRNCALAAYSYFHVCTHISGERGGLYASSCLFVFRFFRRVLNQLQSDAERGVQNLRLHSGAFVVCERRVFTFLCRICVFACDCTLLLYTYIVHHDERVYMFRTCAYACVFTPD